MSRVPIRIRFHPSSARWATVSLVALVALATLGARTGWIRGYVGDALAVVWLVLLMRSVLEAPRVFLALVAFGCGCAIEAVQWFTSIQGWVFPSRVLRIVFGSTPDWWDVVAYALGAALTLVRGARSRP